MIWAVTLSAHALKIWSVRPISDQLHLYSVWVRATSATEQVTKGHFTSSTAEYQTKTDIMIFKKKIL